MFVYVHVMFICVFVCMFSLSGKKEQLLITRGKTDQSISLIFNTWL